MNNRKIYSIGILAIILVVGVPTVYSAVEPHIQITMESSQTQNPFVIKDNFGQEVFSIDPDGVITPSQGGGGISGVFGTEIVLIDNSGNTGGSDNSGDNDGLMLVVTLPTVAPQYRITAVEVLTESVSFGDDNRICIAIADLHGFDYPLGTLPDDERLTIGILSGWNGNFSLEGDNGNEIFEDTVYKIDIVPVILDGGKTFIVIVNECDNGDDISFVTASSGSLAFDWDMDQTDLIDGGFGQLEEADYSTQTTGKTYDGFTYLDGFQLYLKVYGQPLE